MTWEAISAGAAVVTTVVITATAIAALIQIRQLKLATQLEGFLALHSEYASPEMYAAREYVANELPERLRDAKYRDELEKGAAFIATHPELVLGRLLGEGRRPSKLRSIGTKLVSRDGRVS